MHAPMAESKHATNATTPFTAYFIINSCPAYWLLRKFWFCATARFSGTGGGGAVAVLSVSFMPSTCRRVLFTHFRLLLSSSGVRLKRCGFSDARSTAVSSSLSCREGAHMGRVWKAANHAADGRHVRVEAHALHAC